ncbi:MAG: serine/threonine protein kinase [Thermoproteota archaeon]
MAKVAPLVVSVEEVAREPYNLVLCYPRLEKDSLNARIRQLCELGVTHLVFQGRLKLNGLSVLGKGVAGMVAVGILGGRKVALKIRRLDSRRDSLATEARMLQAANAVGVGPEYIGGGPDILAMELVDGERLPLWLTGLRGRGRKSRVKATVRTLLEQCHRLDAAGIDHGELSRAHKNVLVTKDDCPCILDFESASSSRRPSNLTSLTQYLFLGGSLTRKVTRVLGPVDRDELLRCLRLYKKGEAETAFHSTLKLLKL